MVNPKARTYGQLLRNGVNPSPILLVALLLGGCVSPPPPKAKQEHAWIADRSVVRALRDYAHASYDLRLAHDDPGAAANGGLQERLALARDSLRNVLAEAGATGTSAEAELVRLALEGIQRSGRYELVPHGEDSFALHRIKEEGTPREMTLFQAPFAYRVTIYDESLILDYPTYRAEKLGLPTQRKTATYSSDGTVQLDLAAAAAIGEQLFLPRIEALETAAALATQRDSFLALADQPLARVVTLTKNALRWRSLHQLWSTIQSKPHSEQLARFVQDYADRAELRAVAELRELGAAPEDAQSELTDSARSRLFSRGSLVAAIHGEPLGQVADVLALAALSLRADLKGPQFQAARQLVFEFAARLRRGAPSPQADALAFAALAQASPERLRAIAREIYAKSE